MKFLILLMTLLFPFSVQAYLDPGSGSYIIQVLLAALLGGLTALKLFWHKLFSWRKKKEK
jgi:hypothetical protein